MPAITASISRIIYEDLHPGHSIWVTHYLSERESIQESVWKSYISTNIVHDLDIFKIAERRSNYMVSMKSAIVVDQTLPSFFSLRHRVDSKNLPWSANGSALL